VREPLLFGILGMPSTIYVIKLMESFGDRHDGDRDISVITTYLVQVVNEVR